MGGQVNEAHSGAIGVTSSAWIHRYAVRPLASKRLFCFSYAGAGASVYRLWHTGLPSDIEVCAVQLPGREGRLRETPIASIPGIVSALLPAILAFADRPFAIFGHSMGAVVATEVARALQSSGGPVPGHLFVSARRPTGVADPDSPMAHLPDAALVAELNRRYGGIPPEVMEHEELMALLLPGLRADLNALESFKPKAGAGLTMPLHVFGGVDDARVPRAHLEAWQADALGQFRVRQFPGGHFYLASQQAALLEELRAALTPAAEAVVRTPGPG